MTDVLNVEGLQCGWEPLLDQDWANLGSIQEGLVPDDKMAAWDSLSGEDISISCSSASPEDEGMSMCGSIALSDSHTEQADVDAAHEYSMASGGMWPFHDAPSFPYDSQGRQRSMHEDFPPHGLAGEGRDLAGQPPDLAEPRVVAGKQQGRPSAPKIGGQDTFPGLLKRRAEMSGDTRGKNLSLSVPTGEGRALGEMDHLRIGMHAHAAEETALFPVHLYITAIADGPIIDDGSPKAMQVLDQVRSKVSKEQNTVVHVADEGAVDLKMRVFVANSVEARAVSDYIAAHPTQTPAPFVVLTQQLLMAVSYDPAQLNPAHAAVADRLRKQIKTHAVKVLRESIADRACSVTTPMLRGMHGPLAPSLHLEELVQRRTVLVGSDGVERRYIVLPAKNKAVRDESQAPVRAPASPARAQNGPRSMPMLLTHPSGTPLPAHGPGQQWPPQLHLPATPRSLSPDTSVPSTPGVVEDEGMCLAWGIGRPTAHFPVNLFVTAIADGTMARDTPAKVQERLQQIIRKVPKEQNTSVEVCEGVTIDLKMRVFVVNSEDAKAVGEYISGHLDQTPAPFVVLARHLPMAVLYDPQTLDLSDAAVADRLRKQAKTRAVKVLREAIASKAAGITQPMLRGYHGALQPAQHLMETLAARTQPLDGDEGTRCVIFAARNKGAGASPAGSARGGSPAGSPRKRSASGAGESLAQGDFLLHPDQAASPPESPKGTSGRQLGAAGRRGGASSASHLHRNMLSQSLKKARGAGGLDGRRGSAPL